MEKTRFFTPLRSVQNDKYCFIITNSGFFARRVIFDRQVGNRAGDQKRL